MTNEKYMNMIRNNPYVIDRIENPSEEMQLLAVQMNGLALQYIKKPSRKPPSPTRRGPSNSSTIPRKTCSCKPSSPAGTT
ncbi:hypothetical protein [uncultured Megasphaera sp.]|uniref:hypothetical protein n=1 Tax=uncultured Megasphaera sp. TaxID=165188 RepID=UPI00266ECF73|nr:hypothetical protein [uncultured Megasphaera sp.]